MAKRLHIIPHTHWDREWYMGFEEHRIQLVKLVDSIIETMESNPDFAYFHFDGQCIPIEDYLEIRPQMRDRLFQLIQADRIHIGPWYILQDEYLTSGEANVRNMLAGLAYCREHGAKPPMMGYLPDSFGNISQMPQILNGFGIDAAVFGRGLNSMGADNTIVQQNGILDSEITWRSPDGSQVMGVMFANWYHNAMELPTEPEALRSRLNQIIESCAKFATTDELLGMNGCDHQPLQRNLPAVLAEAKRLGFDVTFGNFKEYLEALRPYRDRFKPVTGEIAGQFTNGYMLLINTASARIYIKQLNHAAQNLVEREAEPLASVAALAGARYDGDLFRYAWKKLMQNHPHDSICSCNVDEISSEMVTRFHKSMQVASSLARSALTYLAERADTSACGGNRAVVLFNREPYAVTEPVTFTVDLPEDSGVQELGVFTRSGERLPAAVSHLGRTFTYTLPEDSFRKPKYVDRFLVTMTAPALDGFGYEVLGVKPVAASCSAVPRHGDTWAETDLLRLDVAPNGTFTLTDRRSGVAFPGLNDFEDCGDRGEEYNFVETSGGRMLGTAVPATVRVEEGPDWVTFHIEKALTVPAARDGEHRSPNLVALPLHTMVTLRNGSRRVDIETVIENRAKDHRLRALFPAPVHTDIVHADGQFDVVSRSIQPWEGWENPSNTQRHQAFFELCDDQCGVAVAGRGLHEYEVLPGEPHTMALTLLRAVGEIGDWGVFPAPDAQCLGEQRVQYAVLVYPAGERAAAHRSAAAFSTQPLSAVDVAPHAGDLPAAKRYFRLSGDFLRMSAFKRSEDGQGFILRLYNTSDQPVAATLALDPAFQSAQLCRLDETSCTPCPIVEGQVQLDFPAKKILTLRLQ